MFYQILFAFTVNESCLQAVMSLHLQGKFLGRKKLERARNDFDGLWLIHSLGTRASKKKKRRKKNECENLSFFFYSFFRLWYPV